MHNIFGKMLLYNINAPSFFGRGGWGRGWGEYLGLLFFQKLKAIAGSKVGNTYLTFLMQKRKYCKEITLEWRKVNRWQLKCAKHWTNYRAALSINFKNININSKQKSSIHFNFFEIKNREEIQCNQRYTWFIENHPWLKPCK